MIDLGSFTQGEIPAPLEYGFEDADGAPISFLGGGYNARMTIRERWAALPVVDNATATIPNDATGRVVYTWTAAAFAAPGEYKAELWVGNGSNRFASVRLRYFVCAAVGSVPLI